MSPNRLEEQDFAQLKEIDPIEVSYTVLKRQENEEGLVADQRLLQQIAMAINVQLDVEEGQDLPFIPFNGFNDLLQECKFFLYGPSGCGKSRGIFEVIKQRIQNFERVYIINPRNPIGMESSRTELRYLVARFDRNDLVVWDNFPDDLVKRDIDNAVRVLEILSSRSVAGLFVALKPRYLEIYKDVPNKVAELYPLQVKFDRERFKHILSLYGIDISKFQITFEKYILRNVDRISAILWQKEPIPIAVLDYYKQLMKKQNEGGQSIVDGLLEAEKLLLATHYHEYLFDGISRDKQRQNEVEFLYTVKICYELSLHRNFKFIEQLQKDIFGSAPPREPFKELGNWVYLSGQEYAMHDVPRESVRFNDYVKSRITSYLADNFQRIVPEEPNAVYSFGIYFGRNFQIIPRNAPSASFLPIQIYDYMKSNRNFEIALGQATGENFLLMDEPLQQEILKRLDTDIEFARGLADGLGRSFASLDDAHQKEIFRKITTGLAFPRYFGETLGRVLMSLSVQMQDEILEYSKSNVFFTEGIGIGLGSILPSLNPKIQEQIIERAKNDGDLMRGIGAGLAYTFRSLPRDLQDEYFLKADKDAMLDMGLGLGFSFIFKSLPPEFQDKLFERAEKNALFGYGFSLLLAYNLNYLSSELQSRIYERVEKSIELAAGFGFGLAYIFSYLPKELQSGIFTRSEKNYRLGYGLGVGFTMIFKTLGTELHAQLFAKAEKHAELAEGLGMGLGFTFTYFPQEIQTQFLLKAEKNVQFARGLGYAFGCTFPFLSEELRIEVIRRVEKNSELAYGFGYGYGVRHSYLQKEFGAQFSLIAEKNSELAYGFGDGTGYIFGYLSEDVKNKYYAAAESDVQFAAGLGKGLGHIFMYLSGELRTDVINRIEKNSELAYGFGAGLGYNFIYLSEDLRSEFISRIDHDNRFAAGLGTGVGLVFSYLPPDLQNVILSKGEKNIHFALGLGTGLGRVFKYLDEAVQREILQRAEEDGGLSKGLGISFGATFKLQDPTVDAYFLAKTENDTPFARGVGYGIGYNFQYFSEDIRKQFLERAGRNKELSAGLGEGLAHDFKRLDMGLQDAVLEMSLTNSAFARGLGYCAGSKFGHLSDGLRSKMLAILKENREGKNSELLYGLGSGMGSVFVYFREDLQEVILEMACQSMEFSRGFGFGIAHIFSSLSKELQAKVLSHANAVDKKYSLELSEGLGDGLGHNFLSLGSEQQTMVLKLADQDLGLARGLGDGLAQIFKYLDYLQVQEILLWMLENPSFAGHLGLGLGFKFPSLQEQLQNDILSTHLREDSEFTKGLGLGLASSLRYLSTELRQNITNIAAKNQTFGNALSEGIKDEGVHATRLGYSSNDSHYDDFLLPANLKITYASGTESWKMSEEVSFPGQRQNCCICFIDMMNSTKTTAELTGSEITRYYGIFLNAMATIAHNFGAKIIKNAGDCLIFYFLDTPNAKNRLALIDSLECGITMMAAHAAINSRLYEEKLPSIDYRISSDYGEVQVAKSASSQSDDLFGSIVNVCAKINSKAKPNGMVIGNDLYSLVKSFEGYHFEKIGDYTTSYQYGIYSVETIRKRKILNPFKRTSSSFLG